MTGSWKRTTFSTPADGGCGGDICASACDDSAGDYKFKTKLSRTLSATHQKMYLEDKQCLTAKVANKSWNERH